MELASRTQLRWALLRAMAIIVPVVLLFASFTTHYNADGQDAWFAGLLKPSITPNSATRMSMIWALAFLALGFAGATVWQARGNNHRMPTLIALAVTIMAGLVWAPVFLGERLLLAGFIISIIAVIACMTALAFSVRVRKSTVGLLLLSLVWVLVSAYISGQIWRLNSSPKQTSVVEQKDNMAGQNVQLGQ